MPPDENSPSLDDRYLFWSRVNAAQARNTGWPHERVSRRVVACFEDLCRVVEPTLSLELGAHQATFSTWVKGNFPAARCLAVEANPYVYDQHREELARAGVEYRHLAVAATNGTVTINIPRSVRGKDKRRTNRMASLAIHSRSDENEEVEVTAARVDDLVSVTDEDRLVVWIDVEGAADQVLAGARETLARASAVFIEVESSSTWLGQWLDLDVARYFDGLGKVPVVRDIERPHQYNVVYLDPSLATTPEVFRRVSRVLMPRQKSDSSGP